MAAFNFSALSDGQAITFDVNADDLVFDQSTIAAADLRFTQQEGGTRVEVVSGAQAGKDIFLSNVSPQQLAHVNVQFASATNIYFGDNAVAQSDDGNNTLVGGAGADLVYGFGGNDFLQGGGGTDSIDGGAGNDTMSGNDGNDRVGGGAGNDSVAGGGGQDAYVFAHAGAANADVITDFGSGWDRIVFDAGGFAGLGATGRLASGDDRFHAAAGATGGADAEDRFVYNTTTRQLFYDADGNGAQAAQLVATLQAGANLVATDIWVEAAYTPPPPPPSGGGNTINGTPGNDSLLGTAADETINGLGGDDTINGFAGNDLLVGGDGNDELWGGSSQRTDPEARFDTLNGGLGNDLYRLGNDSGEATTTDVTLIDAGGIDTIEATDWTLGAGFENLILRTNMHQSSVGIGNELDNLIVASSHSNHTNLLEGRAGNDTLRGGEGTDTLLGGAGNDSLEGGLENFEDNFLDGGAGNDTLVGGSSIFGGEDNGLDRFAFSAAPGAANADLIRNFFAGRDDIQLDGNAFANIGASGDFSATDGRFRVGTSAQDADDRVIYNASTGQLFYDADGNGAGAMQLFATIEGAPTVSASQFTVINGTAGTPGGTQNGTAGNDSLVGGAGNDTLNGFGGDDTLDGAGGVDWMDGGTGNDLYFVDEPGDLIVETQNGGIDEVRSTASSYVLPEWVNNLTLLEMHASGTGNAISNVITGTSGAENLSGMGGDDTLIGGGVASGEASDNFSGGDGNDSMVGGEGGDVFVLIDAATTAYGQDTIVGAGHREDWGDRIFVDPLNRATSGVVVDLAAGTLSGGQAGGSAVLSGIESVSGTRFADRMTGNDGMNELIGGAGNDTLDGGASIDRLDGGAGADDYLFTDALDAFAFDRVVGFETGVDRIRLDATVMTQLGASGGFSANDARFFAGAAAHDADDRVIFDGSMLWYDPDGTGSAAQQEIATLLTGSVVATDIFVDNGASQEPTGNQNINGTAGNDTLTGGAGNDTIVGNAGNDVMAGSGGNDFMQGGTGTDTLDGGAGSDTLSGNDGNDRVGGGGGNDTVAGGGGQDMFFFDAFGASNADRVTDFSSGWDRMGFDAAAFDQAGAPGRLASGDDRFFAGAGATGGADAEDRFVYNTSTAQLYYDPDGAGGQAAQLVATLNPGNALAATDINIL